MKKIVSLLLILVLTFSLSLTSCQNITGKTTSNNPNEPQVTFEEMLSYMLAIADTEEGKALINEQTKADLTELSNGLEGFKSQMNSTVNQETFREFGHEKFGDGDWIDPACDAIFKIASDGEETAKIVDVLRLIDRISFLIPAEFRVYIKNYTYVYDVIEEPCAYDEFIPILKKVILALVNEERPVYATEDEVRQVYDIYYANNGAVPQN